MMLRAVRSSPRVIRNSPFVRHLLLLPILLLLASSAIAVSCSRTADSSFDVSRRWHSEVQERDGVTTVRTLNGSVWRGVATLSGELTLGTDQDEDEYLFGRIADAAQVGDRIFVLDVRQPVLRMYDVDGRYGVLPKLDSLVPFYEQAHEFLLLSSDSLFVSSSISSASMS